MRDARRSAFFSAGMFRIVPSRKCRTFASCMVAARLDGESACFQNAVRMRRRRSESASSLRMRRAVHSMGEYTCNLLRLIKGQHPAAVIDGEDEILKEI